jgi:hypothetical protein
MVGVGAYSSVMASAAFFAAHQGPTGHSVRLVLQHDGLQVAFDLLGRRIRHGGDLAAIPRRRYDGIAVDHPLDLGVDAVLRSAGCLVDDIQRRHRLADQLALVDRLDRHCVEFFRREGLAQAASTDNVLEGNLLVA